MPNFVGLALLIMVIFLGGALIYLGYKLFSPVSKEELEEFKQKYGGPMAMINVTKLQRLVMV